MCLVPRSMSILVALLAWAFSDVQAQSADTTPPVSEAGPSVRIATEGQRIVGQLVRGTTTPSQEPCVWSSANCHWLLQRPDTVLAIVPRAIDSLWVQGHNTAKGAGIGAAVLGVSLAVATIHACRSYGEPDSDFGFSCSSGKGLAAFALMGGVIGAAGGAVLGGLIGRANLGWELRFVRPR